MVRAITIRHRRMRGIRLHMVVVWSLQDTLDLLGMRNTRDAGGRMAVLAVAGPRRLRPRGKHLEGHHLEKVVLAGGRLPTRVAHAGESNRARLAGGWGQANPVARRHGRAFKDVRRFAVVDDDARAVGVARQRDILRQQAMVVHELELEV